MSSTVQPFPERETDTFVAVKLATLAVQQESDRTRAEDFKVTTNRRLDEFTETLRDIVEKLDTLQRDVLEIKRIKSVPPGKSEKTDGCHIAKGTVGAIALAVGTVLQHVLTAYLGK